MVLPDLLGRVTLEPFNLPPSAGFLASLDRIELTRDSSWSSICVRDGERPLSWLSFEHGPCLWITSRDALLSSPKKNPKTSSRMQGQSIRKYIHKVSNNQVLGSDVQISLITLLKRCWGSKSPLSTRVKLLTGLRGNNPKINFLFIKLRIYFIIF